MKPRMKPGELWIAQLRETNRSTEMITNYQARKRIDIDAQIRRYMGNGRDCTAQQAAKAINRSLSATRAAILRNGGIKVGMSGGRMVYGLPHETRQKSNDDLLKTWGCVA